MMRIMMCVLDQDPEHIFGKPYVGIHISSADGPFPGEGIHTDVQPLLFFSDLLESTDAMLQGSDKEFVPYHMSPGGILLQRNDDQMRLDNLYGEEAVENPEGRIEIDNTVKVPLAVGAKEVVDAVGWYLDKVEDVEGGLDTIENETVQQSVQECNRLLQSLTQRLKDCMRCGRK